MLISRRFPVIIFAIIAVVVFFSCKKDSASRSSTAFDLQYRIRNASHTITAISFVGPGGDTLSGDISQQSDTLWSTVFTVPGPPFKAGLHASVNNTTSSGVDFFLEIAINGVVRNSVERSIPASAATDASVEYIVN